MQIASEIDSSKLDIRTQSFAHTFVIDFGLIQLWRLSIRLGYVFWMGTGDAEFVWTDVSNVCFVQQCYDSAH